MGVCLVELGREEWKVYDDVGTYWVFLSVVTCAFLLNKLGYFTHRYMCFWVVVTNGHMLSYLDSFNFDILWPVPGYVLVLCDITIMMLAFWCCLLILLLGCNLLVLLLWCSPLLCCWQRLLLISDKYFNIFKHCNLYVVVCICIYMYYFVFYMVKAVATDPLHEHFSNERWHILLFVKHLMMV
jgi:hypothetical protein